MTDTKDWMKMKPMDRAIPAMIPDPHMRGDLVDTATYTAPPGNTSPIDDMLQSRLLDEEGKSNDSCDDDSLIDWFEADVMGMQ